MSMHYISVPGLNDAVRVLAILSIAHILMSMLFYVEVCSDKIVFLQENFFQCVAARLRHEAGVWRPRRPRGPRSLGPGPSASSRTTSRLEKILAVVFECVYKPCQICHYRPKFCQTSVKLPLVFGCVGTDFCK